MEKTTTIAVDLAKNVFEIAVSTKPGKVASRERLRRDKLLSFFAQQPRATVVMEACGSCHDWARRLMALGHEVVLLPPTHVRPYVKNRKTDRTDAAGLLEAYRCADIIPVPVKTPAQQSLLILHRTRSGFMETRIARINSLRAALREFGVVIPVGAKNVLPTVRCLIQNIEESPLPLALRRVLSEMVEEIVELERRIKGCEHDLDALAQDIPAIALLRTVPGMGRLTATALYAVVGDPSRFRSGRHLASFLGLTPSEHSSGDRRRLGHIHKHGDTYLRTLLCHGARAVLTHGTAQANRLREWAKTIQVRRGYNIAVVALASKLARIGWAVWRREQPFRPALAA